MGELFRSIGRAIEAIATAVGAILGLQPEPDPIRVPIEVERDPFR